MDEPTSTTHIFVRNTGTRIVRLLEDLGLVIVLIATLVAGALEVNFMWQERQVRLTDLLLLFIYIEVITMVKVYWESGKLPVRMPLYIAMVALARYLIIDIKDMDEFRSLSVSISILVLALAVLAVRWGHVRLPYDRSDDADTDI